MGRDGRAASGRPSLRVVKRGDFLPLLEQAVGGLAGRGQEKRANCPLPGHEDDTSHDFAVNVETGLWYCHKCGRKGNLLMLLRALGWDDERIRQALQQHALLDGTSKKAVSPRTSKPAMGAKTVKHKAPTEEDVEERHRRLLADEAAMAKLAERGINEDTVRACKLGLSESGVHLCIPIRDAEGKLVNIKAHRLDGQKPKAMNWPDHGEARLFGVDRISCVPSGETVLLCEGELDAIRAWQHGFHAVSGTGGCKTFREEWGEPLHDKHVVVVYDTDTAGREAAANVVDILKEPTRLGRILSIKNVELPFAEGGEGKDVTDWFKAGGTAEELRRLIEATPEVDVHAWPEIHERDRELCTLPSCDPDTLLGAAPSFRDYVQSVAEYLQVPPELPMMLGLSTASLALCGAVVVEPKVDWQEHPPIWTVVLQPPGHRKSATLKEIIRPIRDWCRDETARLKQHISRQRQRRAIAEKQLDKLVADAARGVSGTSIEESWQRAGDLRVELDEEVIIHAPQLVALDATPEAMCVLLANNGERLGLVGAEADVLDIVLGRYADGKPNLGVMLCGYGGESYEVNRKTRDPIYLDRPLIVVGLAIQPESVLEMLGSDVARGRGMVGRCLFVRPQSLLGTREYDSPPIPGELREWWDTTIHSLLALPRPNDYLLGEFPVARRGGEPAVLKLSPEAELSFRRLHQMLEPELSDYGELKEVTDFGGKLMGHIARIALSLHFLRGRGIHDPIDCPTMRSAATFATFLAHHFILVVTEASESAAEEQLGRAVKWLRQIEGRDFNKSELYHALKTSASPKAKDWEPVLKKLAEKGMIRLLPREEGQPGRPPERYEVNPALIIPPNQNPQNPQNTALEGGP